MQACLSELNKKHIEERWLFLQIVQDSSLSELREAASGMSKDDKHKRLAEIHGKSMRLELRDPGK